MKLELELLNLINHYSTCIQSKIVTLKVRKDWKTKLKEFSTESLDILNLRMMLTHKMYSPKARLHLAILNKHNIQCKSGCGELVKFCKYKNKFYTYCSTRCKNKTHPGNSIQTNRHKHIKGN